MNKFARLLGALAVIATASHDCWAVVMDFDGGADNGLFHAPANWNDAIGTDDDLVPGPADSAIINNGFTLEYAADTTTTLASLIIGADWPVTGAARTRGALTMSAGKIIVTGDGDSFQINGAGSGNSNLTMRGLAQLNAGSVNPLIAARDKALGNGLLDVGDNAKVYPPTGILNYWRLGDYGPSFDARGRGILYVHDNGSFQAHVIYLGDNDSTGDLRVADNGSVVLTDNLIARPSPTAQGGDASLISMYGSNATLEARNLESESLPGEAFTQYYFEADASGVSEIKVTDAINVTNNVLRVNLSGFDLGPLGKITLFDGDQALAGNRIFGTFSEIIVDSVSNPANYMVVYDQALGDIQLMKIPEPSTMLLLGVGIVGAASSAKRRASRLASSE